MDQNTNQNQEQVTPELLLNNVELARLNYFRAMENLNNAFRELNVAVDNLGGGLMAAKKIISESTVKEEDKK